MTKKNFKISSVTPIILTGGNGSRLWPLSRASYPKQFLDLMGERSLFQETISRLNYSIFERPYLLTNYQHRFIAAEQIGRLCVKPQSIILEPVSRNTGPAILTATLLAAEKNAHEILLFLPSDQFIADNLEFCASVERGIPATRDGKIVIFGVEPTSAHTGYGYIKTNKKISKGVRSVAEFSEKPTLQAAQRYMREGSYLWNAGMFMATAKTLITAFKKHNPQMLKICRMAIKNAVKETDFTLLDQNEYEKNDNISIDYAVIEKHENLACVSLATYWNDLGTWASIAESVTKDQAGNYGHGDVIFEKSENCYAHSSDNATIAVLGLENIVTVATSDAILVASKDKAEDVKNIVDRLKILNMKSALSHRRVYRPWGWFEGLGHDHRYQVKCINVNPGSELSLQSHHHRAEHWIVVSGTAKVTLNGTTKLMSENDSIYVPLGAKHRLKNPGKIPTKLIEVQTGSYLEEDDIIRYEDIYKRKTKDAKNGA